MAGNLGTIFGVDISSVSGVAEGLITQYSAAMDAKFAQDSRQLQAEFEARGLDASSPQLAKRIEQLRTDYAKAKGDYAAQLRQQAAQADQQAQLNMANTKAGSDRETQSFLHQQILNDKQYANSQALYERQKADATAGNANYMDLMRQMQSNQQNQQMQGRLGGGGGGGGGGEGKSGDLEWDKWSQERAGGAPGNSWNSGTQAGSNYALGQGTAQGYHGATTAGAVYQQPQSLGSQMQTGAAVGGAATGFSNMNNLSGFVQNYTPNNNNMSTYNPWNGR